MCSVHCVWELIGELILIRGRGEKGGGEGKRGRGASVNNNQHLHIDDRPHTPSRALKFHI